MNTITQTMRFRQAVIPYSLKYGVTKAAIRHRTNRQYIYCWQKRYDGTIQSLADRFHCTHSHPNQPVSGFYRFLRKSGQMAVKLPNPKYIPKPYEPMQYPGQRVQIDVKAVPSACLVGEMKGQKLYQ